MAKILHEPKLDTIIMVEQAIKEAESYPNRRSLWKSLPRQIQYQTFMRILEYLEASNKILFNGRSILWIAVDNPKLKKLLASAVRIR